MVSKEDLLEAESVRRIVYDGEDYFCLVDVALLLEENLDGVERSLLPYGNIQLKFSTYDQIEAGRTGEPLSDFNKYLLKGRKSKK